jgi:hypothetical protein
MPVDGDIYVLGTPLRDGSVLQEPGLLRDPIKSALLLFYGWLFFSALY